jgi:hypothetical protein
MAALLDTFYDACGNAIWDHDGLLNKTIGVPSWRSSISRSSANHACRPY